MRERVLHDFAFAGEKIDQTFIRSRIWKDFLNVLTNKKHKKENSLENSSSDKKFANVSFFRAFF